MLFNTFDFIFGLLPLTVWAYDRQLRTRGPRAAAIVLVASSLFFYAWWYAPYLLLLLASIAVNFDLGRRLGDETLPDTHRHRMMVAGIVLNLGVLGFFKYTGWMVENVELLLGTNIPFPHLALPIGISFYTFQQVAYLVDARRGLCREHDLIDYTLFVTFFAQLIAGPIVHHGEVLPQFREGRVPTSTDRAVGLTFFALGLAKKVLVADVLSWYADTMYGRAAMGVPVTTAMAWLGLLAYHFQLYFDFSGYSDMAIGLGRLFGIKLPANFDAPYRCNTPPEFWRRWHLTLSRFMRDYLYIPLGGNRISPNRTLVNLWITMFLAGIWHGSGWVFVLWGIQMATYNVAHELWVRWTGGLPATPWAIALARTCTWFLLIASWPLFRGDSVSAAVLIWQGMFGLSEAGGGRFPVHLMVVFAALTWWVNAVPTSQQFMRHFDPVHTFRPIDRITWSERWTWRPTRGWAIAMGLLFFACIPLLDRADAFLYWNF